MFNRSILMGRICNELVLNTTPSGKSVTAFRVAVERAFCPKGGEREVDLKSSTLHSKKRTSFTQPMNVLRTNSMR